MNMSIDQVPRFGGGLLSGTATPTVDAQQFQLDKRPSKPAKRPQTPPGPSSPGNRHRSLPHSVARHPPAAPERKPSRLELAAIVAVVVPAAFAFHYPLSVVEKHVSLEEMQSGLKTLTREEMRAAARRVVNG
jgi:hypothetical protein